MASPPDRDAVFAFIASRPAPVPQPTPAQAADFEELDGRLADFAADSALAELSVPALNGLRRLWMHRRAEQLGLRSESSGEGQVKDLRVEKPPGWSAATVLPPVPKPTPTQAADYAAFDRILVDFAADPTCVELKVTKLDAVERRWMHDRAEQLGLLAVAVGQGQFKDIRVQKTPKTIPTKAADRATFDKLLADFAADPTCFAVEVTKLNAVQRRWVHRRAKELGMLSVAVGQGQFKDIRVEKPPEWPVAAAKKRQKMEACQQALTRAPRVGALYHYSGMGPLCEDCVEGDPELERLKWEPKASFRH
ncbi:hypothetical protein DFJ74DRAFT_766729 [Hyaloraphidium curvatum]|nr:hypothetical protein DFJ74DRAFT_766729 [Hyaloraphidium curvatum]